MFTLLFSRNVLRPVIKLSPLLEHFIIRNEQQLRNTFTLNCSRKVITLFICLFKIINNYCKLWVCTKPFYLLLGNYYLLFEMIFIEVLLNNVSSPFRDINVIAFISYYTNTTISPSEITKDEQASSFNNCNL